ncbi:MULTISPECIES: glycosyltransferase family 4 protein [unclassified Bizionia]|uniref:glycosyltransferase family 4 protein n=1 Tax=unclassified Bizionia TaxID=2626393 RepID=UPI0020472A32|nr:glycosyltransferase family 4 protein [Bizionia sp. M204]UPS91660.1 glycosyltransferase [Bizionia sp. M204]
MKILIFYTHNQGLLSSFFQELSEKLCQDGYEVDNFYLKNKRDFFFQKGIHVYGDKRAGYYHNYKSIFSIIKKCKPDVIISNFSYINPALLFGKLLGVKRNIAWFHTAYGHTKPNWLKILNKTFYLNLADVVLANSMQLQNEMHEVYKVPKQKTKCISFWTNISDYRNRSNFTTINSHEPVLKIGCPGRLLADKNHVSVIKAIYELKRGHENTIHLYIAGDGPYKQDLERLVGELELNDTVSFMGLLNVPDMVAYYDAMDVVVLPSFHEAFGLVFIEAIALGRPVLVSKSFGALGFIDAEKFPIQDFSFNPYDIPELINKLEPYMVNNGLKSDYFKMIYDATFQKDVIYNQIKTVILNQTMPSS